MNKNEFLLMTNQTLSPLLIDAVVLELGSWDDFVKVACEHVERYPLSNSEAYFFFKRYRPLILELLYLTAMDSDIGTAELVSSFDTIKERYTREEIGDVLWRKKTSTAICSALSQFAIKEVCRVYAELCGDIIMRN